MKLLIFANYQAYLLAQKRTAMRRRKIPGFTSIQIKTAAEWLMSKAGCPTTGICHGAKHGLECDEFRKTFTRATVYGTDLYPDAGIKARRPVESKTKVIVHDFQKRVPRWVGKFDFVYSNSLDHASDPMTTLGVWMEQLKPDGRLLLSWTEWSENVSGGDCFGATLWEYVGMCNEVGMVEGLIYSDGARGLSRKPRHPRGLEAVVIGVKGRTQ